MSFYGTSFLAVRRHPYYRTTVYEYEYCWRMIIGGCTGEVPVYYIRTDEHRSGTCNTSCTVRRRLASKSIS